MRGVFFFAARVCGAVRRTLFFCCGHARGVFLFAAGAGRVLFFAAGARHVCVFAAGARRAFLCAAGARRVSSGAQCVFLCAAGARRVFFAAGVWRGLSSTAGAGGGAVHGGWMRKPGGAFLHLGAGGMMGLRRRVYVFAAGARGVCFGRFSRGAWEINRAAFKLAWLGLARLGFSGGGGLGGEGAACPLPPKHTPDPIAGCDVQFLWHFVCVCGAMALCVHGSFCGYKHDWAPAASNKDTVAMGFRARNSDGGVSYTWSP